MNFTFSVITGRTTHRVIHSDLRGCTEQVRIAYEAHGRQHSVNPSSYFLTFPEKPGCRIIALPAYLGERFDVSGIKWIASYPDNIHKGFPRASAVLVLNSYETGYPFAVLESSVISAARTAASAALAAGLCRRGQRVVRSLAIVGTGLIARYVYTFLRAEGFDFGRVVLHDLAQAEAERFRDQVLTPAGQRDVVVSGLEPALRESDLVVLTTVAGTPYIHDPSLFAHNPVVLNISLRDLAPEVILSGWNVVDDVEHVLKANTSVHLTEQQVGNRAFLAGTIPDLIAGRIEPDASRPVFVSPFGLGVLDLAVGKWVYDQALKSGEAIDIPDFFFELTR